jgi:hypothetical protein
MKFLNKHGISVEANNEFYDGCALGKAHRQCFGTVFANIYCASSMLTYSENNTIKC